jgi:hypothetical protein
VNTKQEEEGKRRKYEGIKTQEERKAKKHEEEQQKKYEDMKEKQKEELKKEDNVTCRPDARQRLRDRRLYRGRC